MPVTQQQQTFRVFVSSTFSDFADERTALQRHVFPRVQQYCRQRGARFQAVDLRWGVSADAARDHQTIRICLEELRRCQQTSPGLNFLAFIGDRYGWRPLPPFIPALEYEGLQQHCTQDECERIARWYRRDDNGWPAVYELQPRGEVFANPQQWAREEHQLHGVLSKAAQELFPASDPRRATYEASATHQEILAGLLNAATPRCPGFCYLRQSSSGLADQDHRDRTPDGVIDENAQARLADLKGRLRGCMPREHLNTYAASEAGLGELCDWVAEDLKKAIDRELEEGSFAEEEPVARLSFAFARERARHFLGRQDVLDRIEQYLEGPSCQPLVLSGPAGSGKSTILAHVALGLQRAEDAPPLALRHIGAVAGTDDLRSLLTGLCEELSRLLDLEGQRRARLAAISAEDPEAEQTRREIVQSFEIPAAIEELRITFARFLGLVGEQRLVVLLDALDQLSPTDAAWELTWLPRELPAGVKMIVSALEAEGPAGTCLSSARRLLPDGAFLALGPQATEEANLLLDAWLKEVNRTLGRDQRAVVLRGFHDCPRPLYLRLAFEEAARWRSWEGIPEAQGRPEDIPSILERLFARLEREANHGRMFVSRSLGYLCASRNGLSEEELLDVLSADRDVWDDFTRRSTLSPRTPTLPHVIWSRLLFDLSPYLSEREANHSTVLSYYHREVGETAARRYLHAGEKERAHHALASSFSGNSDGLRQPHWFERPAGGRLPNYRKLAELPYQLAQAGQGPGLLDLLLDLTFLEAKAEAEMLPDLLADLRQASIALPSEALGRLTLALIEEALAADLRFLSVFPSALFQCLWNRCWWHDAPAAAKHYDSPTDGWPAEGPPWQRSGLKLCDLLEKWRAEKEQHVPGFLWVRSLRPPPDSLGGVIRRIVHDPGRWGDVLAFSADGREMVCGGDRRERQPRVWDLEGNGAVALLGPGGNRPRCAAFAPDGERLATGSEDGAVEVWCKRTGVRNHRLEGHRAAVQGIAWSPDGKLLASGSEDRTIRLWDSTTGTLLAILHGHRDAVCSVLYSADGQYLISTGEDKTVRVWSVPVAQGKQVSGGWWRALRRWWRFWERVHPSQIRRLRTRSGPHHPLAVSPDGRYIVTASDSEIDVWRLSSDGRRVRLSGHLRDVCGLAFSPDGRLLATCAGDQAIRLWEVGSWKSVASLAGNLAGVARIAFAKDGDTLLSTGGERDASVRCWQTQTSRRQPRLRWDTGLPWRRLAFSRDGRLLAHGAADPSLRIWNTDNGTVQLLICGLEGRALATAFAGDGKRVAATHGDNTLRVWDVARAEQLSRRGELARWLGGLVRFWERWGGVELLRVQGAPEIGSELAFSRDGTLLATGGEKGLVRVWDAGSGKELHKLKGHEGPIGALAFFPEERRLASVSAGSLRIWDLATGEQVRSIPTNLWHPQRLVVTAGGERLAVVDLSREVKLWDGRTGEQLPEPRGRGNDELLGTTQDQLRWWEAQVGGFFACRALDPDTEVMAGYPEAPTWLAASPARDVWAGVSFESPHVVLFRLEGKHEMRDELVSPAAEPPLADVPGYLRYVPSWLNLERVKQAAIAGGCILGFGACLISGGSDFWSGLILGALLALVLHVLTLGLRGPGRAGRSLPEGLGKFAKRLLGGGVAGPLGSAISGGLVSGLLTVAVVFALNWLGLLRIADVAAVVTKSIGWEKAHWTINIALAGAIAGAIGCAVGGTPGGLLGTALEPHEGRLEDRVFRGLILGPLAGALLGVVIGWWKPPAVGEWINTGLTQLLDTGIPRRETSQEPEKRIVDSFADDMDWNNLAPFYLLMAGLCVGGAGGTLVGWIGIRNGLALTIGVGLGVAAGRAAEAFPSPECRIATVTLLAAIASALAGAIARKPRLFVGQMAGILSLAGAAATAVGSISSAAAGGAVAGALLGILAICIVREPLVEALQGVLGGTILGTILGWTVDSLLEAWGPLAAGAVSGAVVVAGLAALLVVEDRIRVLRGVVEEHP